MTDSDSTHNSLLYRLRDQADDEAWLAFEQIYSRIILKIAMRHGLQSADAADVAQNVLLKIHGSIANYQPDSERARFRTWLHTVTHRAIIDFLRRAKPDRGSGRSSVFAVLEQIPDWDIGSSEQLETEYRKGLFQHVADRVRLEFSSDAFQAFWQTFVDGESVDAVAKRLGKSAGSVYASRSRVLSRIRELAKQLDMQEGMNP